ncbi:helix-turn-helix domain-containing protein [Aeribacillus pallidus]|uniref:Transcriptional regulator n=1 Tax=Aeribacillus phage AP45 TaxID=1913112 RepID=A0A1L2JY18_9CAUD|nr:helix-turn-helix transcriptional regulator [Aeribacillus pallidus]YP_009831919.1 transcriptional regulator [Aeribacillus phage AP45]APC46455.1 transcriptional regulator [Aeribacillus phage AP45]
MSILAKRLKYLRDKHNYSQKKVAESLGISNVQLSRYETGDRKPDPEMIAAFAEFYNVSTDYLLGKTDNPTPKEIVKISGKEIELTPEELKLFEELKKHPALFHDLASDPEGKVKELLKLYKMKKILLEDDDEDYGDGFGELDD